MRLLTIFFASFAPSLIHAELVAKRDGNNVRVEIGGQLFTEYRADKWVPCLYPLMTSHGTHYTRRFPFESDVAGEEKDHPHHVGFWFTHGAVNGSDYWHGSKDGSRIITKDFASEAATKSEGGADSVRFAVNLEWIGKGGERDLSERRVYEIAVSGVTRTIDVECELKAADGDVVFGDTKEGSFAIRLTPTLRYKGVLAKGHILNSAGAKDDAAWGKRAAWVAYHGPDSKGNSVVVALMDGKNNLRHPTWWHARDYGLLTANPFGPRAFKDKSWKGKEGYVLKHGKTLRQAYRLILHEGDLSSLKMDAQWVSFSK